MEMRAKTERLWTRSFALLWQGQLVSILGDTVYAIALGFWLLATTGSTALMGTLMAVSLLPRILVAPVAGVVVGFAVPAVGVLRVNWPDSRSGLSRSERWMMASAGTVAGPCAFMENE